MRRICCFSPDRATLDDFAPALTRCLPGVAARGIRKYPSGDELRAELGADVPEICFVDAVSNPRRALELIQAIQELDARIPIIVLLAADDPDLILRCLRAGAAEFLLQPYEVDQVQAALAKLKITVGSATPGNLAKVYCVIPAKGACGASTIACNLAFQWKRLGSRRVLLADLDPLTGSTSFLLKINSGYSFLDALQRAEGLDADLWKGIVTAVSGVDVLLAPELLVQGVSEAREAAPIIEFARRNYDVVFLDAGSAYGEWNLSQARACDEVLLVTTNELPALHGAQRALSYLEANEIPKWKIRVIVNRYDKNVGVGKELVASALHTDVLDTIPSDYEAVQKALLDGKPLAPNTPLGRTLGRLAEQLSGRVKEPRPRTAPFGGLLSLFSRSS